MATPNFIDQRQRATRPDISQLARVRFLTTTDFPPFNFLDETGRLTGFNVDLVRAICGELGILSKCQIQAVPFDELVPTLERGGGEAIIAGLALNTRNRAHMRFSSPYFQYPARFVTPADAPLADPLAEAIQGRRIGVAAGSAHAAMLEAFFPQAERVTFESAAQGLAAMRKGEVAAYFGDGVTLSFWLESEAAEGCCVFSGGPYLSDHFLGEGLAVAVSPNNRDLSAAIDYALASLIEKGRFTELMLRYFPISAF